MTLRIEPGSIDGVSVVSGPAVSDHRGRFQRLFCELELASVLNGRRIVQINHSRTASVGAVRGVHFQHAPFAEMKLVRCVRGRVWDVAVDLRRSSPTFLRWQAVELSADNRRMYVIPEGCGHAFQCLEPESELLYLHTAPYVPSAEGGVCHDDPLVGVDWPLPVRDLSQRDLGHPRLTEGYPGIQL